MIYLTPGQVAELQILLIPDPLIEQIDEALGNASSWNTYAYSTLVDLIKQLTGEDIADE